MINHKIPVLKLAVFGTFLVIGLWMARTIHDPFHHSKPAEPNFSIGNSPIEQYRLLLVVVDNISAKPVLQSVWWIGSREDMPTAMVSIYPSVTQQDFRDDDLVNIFKLSGIWGRLEPNQEFFDLLDEWDIRWNDYLIIDMAVQEAIIDQIGGVVNEGQKLNGKGVNEQAKILNSSRDKLSFQSRVWRTLCSYASRKSEGLNLDGIPLNLKNHTLTSLKSSKESPIAIFPYQPTFPVCMVNAGLMEAAVPPFLPTK